MRKYFVPGAIVFTVMLALYGLGRIALYAAEDPVEEETQPLGASAEDKNSPPLPENGDAEFAVSDLNALPTEIDAQAVKEISQCFHSNDSLSPFLMQNRLSLSELKKLPGAKVVSYEQINVHYSEGGDSMRLSIINEKGEGPKLQTRLFKVDTDGLPTRMPLPEEWNGLSPTKIFATVRAEKKITRLQKNTIWQIGEKISMTLYEDNGRIQNLMVHFKDKEEKNKTLGCHTNESLHTTCKCM